MNTKEILKSLGACEEALEWSEKHPLPEQAWNACVRSDWLLWTACAVGVNSSTMTRVVCNLARSAIHLANPCEKNRQAARAAYAAADAAADAAAAADADAFAAYAAARAVYAAVYADAYAAADADAFAAYAAARADIIRSSIAWAEVEKLTLARIREA